MLTERENAIRAAAFFDSEGNVSISPDHFGIRCGIVSTDMRLPQWLQENYSGHIRAEKPKGANTMIAYRWVLYSNDAYQFLKLTSPFLLLKFEQAQVAIELRDLQIINKGKRNIDRFALYTPYKYQLTQLNKRGTK